MGQLPKLEILEILKQDAGEILSSRSKSKVLHKTKDIDASGDEVENVIRRVIRKKLPIKYYVSQGHIVDKELCTSPQLDIIIADNSGSPVLFTSENGTEYFPYESIYSFGEIKSTYYSSKKYISGFINSTKSIYEELKREETKPEQITQDFSLNAGKGVNLSLGDSRPYKNPLFKFMIFVNSNDFKIEDFQNALNTTTDEKHLPNIICFLDKGIIVKAEIVKLEDSNLLGPIKLYPEFISDKDKNDFKWVFLEFGTLDERSAANFAFLIFALNDHLKKCLVLRPEILNYFNTMFNHNGQIIE